MFTGIIETIGRIEGIDSNGTNKTFRVSSEISKELNVDQSVSHNGVCLTVENVSDDSHVLTAIKETLDVSNLGNLKTGDFVNLERCMVMNGRIDGHIVQGHVDDTGICEEIIDNDGSWTFTFSYNSDHKGLLIHKGSITVNGTSLTISKCTDSLFSVSIIPYTFENTIFKFLKIGSQVNLEFDMIGKYVLKNINR